jgi:hypothetical protein
MITLYKYINVVKIKIRFGVKGSPEVLRTFVSKYSPYPEDEWPSRVLCVRRHGREDPH